jgi:hypothetical protein
MKKSVQTMILCGLLAALSSMARTDECFCLIHATGAILRGCEAYKAPNDAYPTATCVDPETNKKSEQTMYSEWKRVEAGADRCVVCKPPQQPRRTIPVPRGEDNMTRPRQ